LAIPQRIARFNELLKEEIGILVHNLKDPRIGFVTVTGVEASNDLKYATVMVSILGNEKEREVALEALTSARGFIQSELGKRLRLKYTPSLKFNRDDTIEKSLRISKILEEISKDKSEQSRTE
jgi:ribosome-binding factor A